MVSQVRVELTKGQSASLIAQGQVTCMFTNQSIRLDFPSPTYLLGTGIKMSLWVSPRLEFFPSVISVFIFMIRNKISMKNG